MVLACERMIEYRMARRVAGGSKWRAGMRETQVRMERWCEGDLRQQNDDGGGCALMRERSERVESPGTYVTVTYVTD